MKNKAVLIIVFSIALCCAPALSAQTAAAPAKEPTSTKTPETEKTPKRDLDRFFKDAEEQTRKAQDSGNSNCVPKPKDHSPKDPVS